jgi:hypothetical protein
MRILAIVAAATALAAPAAFAKEGAQAHLLAPLPRHPAPGRLITVRWTVDVAGPGGRREGFNALGMFVRLVGPKGASTTALAREDVGPPYSARIRVPRGGIRAIRFGIHGSTDFYFPLEQKPR